MSPSVMINRTFDIPASGILLVCALLIPLFARPNPAILQGVITNGATGMPVVGAKVTVNSHRTLSTAGGVYTLAIDPPGSFPVSCSKAGFDSYASPPVSFQGGATVTLNIQLWETTLVPADIHASLDTAAVCVSISWNAPSGSYELLYDDGITDNFTVWAAQGNMNALRFTPAGYPAKITGGQIHIGNPGNYPPGSNPLQTFQVRLYDAAGTGGSPGNSLAGPFDVTPLSYGWNEFTLPVPVTITSGDFYLAMVQGGNAPHAAGVAVDETTPQYRSYSRFISGGGPWFPAGGNFMIRVVCEGPGGPPPMADNMAAAGNYALFRLRQGEEQNPAAWVPVDTLAATGFTDCSWPALPCGPYRWGVMAGYPGNRWSATSFSNVLGKCWTAQVNIQAELSCDSAPHVGTSVRLLNLAYPDTMYHGYTNPTGAMVFPGVWKGIYKLTLCRFGYDTITQQLPVTGPVSLGLNMMQVKSPPVNLEVDDSSLLARWDVPNYEQEIFSETWSGGTFTAQGWTTQGGVNWGISQTTGKPAPSAAFTGIPLQTGYVQTLTSRTIHGPRSTLLKLRYDIFLDSYATTTLNQMSVEIWDGSLWHTLTTYDISGGDLPWTRADTDISGFSELDFQVRFRASGEDSYDISNWNIDNIAIVASEPAQEQNDCILGYYFYLDNVISGYTAKNAYLIPGNHVQYGDTYQACVRAIYGSGYSDPDCVDFTSYYLYPATNISGYPLESTAYILWEKPMAPGDTTMVVPPGLLGYMVLRDDSVIAAIPDPDSLSYRDENLEPGYYRYGITALYDLEPYGFPGQTAGSQPAGPLHITIAWGRDLPFFEPWDEGSFSFNDWRFEPVQGNWEVTTGSGNPVPAAGFAGQPPVTGYSYALESPVFNGLPYTCAVVWLDFDLRLDNRTNSGTEQIAVEIYYNNVWHTKMTVDNMTSRPWTPYHLDISQVRGKGFRVRFRASGANSAEILNWNLDNIRIYPVCYPATNLAGTGFGNIVNLTWSPPVCHEGNLLHEGFEQPGFPPEQWNILTTNPDATWEHIPAGSSPGVHTGNYSAGINWDYDHQDEWLIAENVYVTGDLTFWSYAYQGSLHQDHYYVKVSQDEGNSWDILLDLSALPPYPGPNGINDWMTPYTVDLAPYDGETVDIAWQAVDGDGNGLWYPWAIDDCAIGADDRLVQISPLPGTEQKVRRRTANNPDILSGYDIYRSGPSSPGFTKITPVPVVDTTFVDEDLPSGQYRYFVRALFEECGQPADSDTILVDIITGLRKNADSGITIFPNPATGSFTIKSDRPVTGMILYSVDGSLAANWPGFDSGQFRIMTEGLDPGIYILRIDQVEAACHLRICILKKF